jgi:hypothetical protein
MNLDDQLRRYFGTTDFGSLTAAVLDAGVERMRVDFGLEQDPGRRFALWVMLHMFEAAPDIAIAFEREEERQAARNFLAMERQTFG